MKRIISFFIISCFAFNSFAQSDKEFKKMFAEAWSYFLYEDYEIALPIYLDMADKGYMNANIDYAMGMCYLFGDFENKNEKAVQYLKSATENVTADYKEGNYKINQAPQEAFYYLGRAYKINYQFDLAIDSYEKYKTFLGVDEIFALEMVDLQLEHCNNAKEIMKKPVSYTKTNLGEEINNEDDNYNGFYSGDGTTMFFTTRMEIYDREYDETNIFDFVYMALKDDYGGWTSPKDITRNIGSDGFSSATHTNTDASRILFFTDDWGVGNIYESKKDGRRWNPIEKIKKPISSKDNEMHACFGENENIMYFTSTRADGLGGSDIYVSFQDADGKWGEPINLGSNINTPYNEETPFLLPDGKTMYFSSEGHYSMGGLDIFVTTKQDNGQWSVPRNIGYPINTSDDDMFYYPYENGKKALYSMNSPEGYGKRDIYDIEIIALPDFEEEPLIVEETTPDPVIEQDSITYIAQDEGVTTQKDNTSFITYGGDLYEKTDSTEITETETYTEPIVETTPVVEQAVAKTVQIKGRLSLQDNKDINSSFSINLYDNLSNDFISTIQPEYASGSYSYTADPGNYRLTFGGTGYESVTKYVEIPEDYASNDIMVNVSLIPLEVSKGEYFVSKSVFFDYNDHNLNRNTKIEIEKLHNVMNQNPSLYIEVTGHTDSRGDDEYNQQLSVKRARSVINYLSNKGISSQRFVAKGLGESAIIAVNENPDGSDNPEGRKFNRRVDIKILKGGDNVVLRDPDVPSYLASQSAVHYTIFLAQTEKELPPSYFNKYPNEAINNVWVFPTEGGFMYTVGQYKNKADAVHLLNKALDVGFPEAEIIDSEEFAKQRVTGTAEYREERKREAIEMKSGDFTIQIMALRHPVDISYFKNLEGVQMHTGSDNIYRYYFGKFKGIEAAKSELEKLVDIGYADAFVMKMKNFQ